jgi:hypothetical protein
MKLVFRKIKMFRNTHLSPNTYISDENRGVCHTWVISTYKKPFDCPWRKRMFLAVKELERDPFKACMMRFELMFFALQ